MKIRGASIRVRAEEICVPPSGEGPARRRQAVYSSSIRLTGPCVLGPGALTTYRAEVPIPDKDVYSFVSPNNRVEWEVKVLVDVPTWPDWERVFPLVVWPEGQLKIEEVDRATPEPPPSVESPSPKSSVTPDPSEIEVPLETQAPMESDKLPEVDLLSESPDVDPLSEPQETLDGDWIPEIEMPSRVQESPEPDDLREPPTPPVSEDSTFDLSDAIQAILEEDPLSGRRAPLVKGLLEKSVSFDLSVEKVERTFGRFSDSHYRNGRTVSGTIAGTGVAVSVWFPEAQNEEVDAFKRGSDYHVNGAVEDWDSLRKRPNIRAREEGGRTE